jgi:hypothetical protein
MTFLSLEVANQINTLVDWEPHTGYFIDYIIKTSYYLKILTGIDFIGKSFIYQRKFHNKYLKNNKTMVKV